MSSLNTTHAPKKRTISGDFESTVAGIPCRIDVITYSKVEGSYDYNAASDWDYRGYEDIEFDVLDRKGYRAAWLERKMSLDDKGRIEEEIATFMSGNTH